LIKADLKLPDWTRGVWKDGLKMLDRLQERVGLGTGRRFLIAAQKRANHLQASAQSSAQMIKRRHVKQRVKRQGGGIERKAAQPKAEQRPQQRGGDTVPGQHIGQKDRERASTAPALAAIRAKDTLPPETPPLPAIGIIAAKKAVTIERFRAKAEWALQLF